MEGFTFKAPEPNVTTFCISQAGPRITLKPGLALRRVPDDPNGEAIFEIVPSMRSHVEVERGWGRFDVIGRREYWGRIVDTILAGENVLRIERPGAGDSFTYAYVRPEMMFALEIMDEATVREHTAREDRRRADMLLRARIEDCRLLAGAHRLDLDRFSAEDRAEVDAWLAAPTRETIPAKLKPTVRGLIHLLEEADVDVVPEDIDAWTPEQREQAESWVWAALGPDDDCPPRPAFLPEPGANNEPLDF